METGRKEERGGNDLLTRYVGWWFRSALDSQGAMLCSGSECSITNPRVPQASVADRRTAALAGDRPG